MSGGWRAQVDPGVLRVLPVAGLTLCSIGLVGGLASLIVAVALDASPWLRLLAGALVVVGAAGVVVAAVVLRPQRRGDAGDGGPGTTP